MLYKTLIAAVAALVVCAATNRFEKPAKHYGVNPTLLEGICRYESDSGRSKLHRNKNGTWDVGYCQNHIYYDGEEAPEVPKDWRSIRKGAKELAYWDKQHTKFCVNLYESTNKCRIKLYGKLRGVKNCQRPHFWWGHYNWGFRVLSNNYDRKVLCFIRNNFKKCKEDEWRSISYDEGTKF